MYESPSSLEDLCLDTVCDNLRCYVEPFMTPNDKWEPFNVHIYDDDDDEDENRIEKFRFRDRDIFLINEISERLLIRLGEKNYLNNATLQIFTGDNTKLRKVRIKNPRIDKKGLSILKEHNLVDIQLPGSSVGIGQIIDCLNEWTLDNLAIANFSQSSFIDCNTRHCSVIKVSKLANLRSLDLSYTQLNQVGFQMICEDLKLLENLSIAGTLVTDLRPIGLLAGRLTSLCLCDLVRVNYLTQSVRDLNLRHLDISVFNEKLEYESNRFNPKSSILNFLEDTQAIPGLLSLDISGWRDVTPRSVLISFLETHPKLQFLGLVLNSLTFDPVFCDSHASKIYPNLHIAGLGNEEQIKVTLKRYTDRASYIQKALYHLFQLTNSFQEARPAMFNLVLPVMKIHSLKFGVQMAATACLYNLTRGELSKNIHPKALSEGVNLTLIAMESFPDEFQLQKNSILTLCSDRILQEVNFNRFHCAKLVLDALCAFEDVNMNRMAVAICSILAAKVSTEQTSELGARPVYMRKLLSMVQNRVDSRVSDITLKFTLSALWNLTDESAATCTVFLEQGGAYLFLSVLRTFKDDSSIETKVLGLLNNIAEVVKLRHSLMLDTLMSELHVLLKSENIDVSYFAAGIVAHLASGGAELWTVKGLSRTTMLLELEAAVTQWTLPDTEMVAYRSFKPFFPLLKVEMDYQVQLWAVWAISHVCTKNPKRYCLMLKEEKGVNLLCDLIGCCDTLPEIKCLCMQILDTLEINGLV